VILLESVSIWGGAIRSARRYYDTGDRETERVAKHGDRETMTQGGKETARLALTDPGAQACSGAVTERGHLGLRPT
jgi:hypothetical protein